MWYAADEEVYDPLVGATIVDIFSVVIDLGSNFNWYGVATFSKICLFKDGYIYIAEDCNRPTGAILFGATVNRFDPGQGGSVKYLIKTGDSIKISFEDVPFHEYYGNNEGVGNVQAQMELFQNGDIIICYGLGDLPEGYSIGTGVTGVETLGTTYFIPDPPFNGDYATYAWPECQCWKFLMPQTPPS